MLTLTRAAARRVALAAQGFATPRVGRVTMRQVQRTIDAIALFQVDSVNILQRAHLMPLYSRWGTHDVGLLGRASGSTPRRLVEYWAHCAALVDVSLQPALRFRMEAARDSSWASMQRLRRERPEMFDEVLAAVEARGPVTARQLDADDGPRRRDHWGWNWSEVKIAMEHLWLTGHLTPARRNSSFEREHDLTRRVLPRHVLEAPTPARHDAHVTLVRRAARALGVASEACLNDYFRTSRVDVRPAIAELEANGELVACRVRDWDTPTWLWHEAARPRRVTRRALLSPFDSMVFTRDRLQGLFDVDYRIEIYVPAAQRRWGYYVYLFLREEEFAARVDLKAHRSASVLEVRAAWRDPAATASPSDIAHDLAGELTALAAWLGLGTIRVADKGDLAVPLTRCLG